MPIFDCPDCETAIIGRYGDLLTHVRDEHPLAAKLLVNEDGETVEDRIKTAQKDRLKQRIEDEMVVSEKADKEVE